ncbi:hypothetical protein AOLI_G00025700 [Acnodon oligacanthus]
MNDNDLAEDLGCAGGIDRRIIRGPVLLIISGEVIRGTGVGALSAVTICQWDEVCCKGQLTAKQKKEEEEVNGKEDQRRFWVSAWESLMPGRTHETAGDGRSPLSADFQIKPGRYWVTLRRTPQDLVSLRFCEDSSGAQNTDLTSLQRAAAVGNKTGPLLPPTESQPPDQQLILAWCHVQSSSLLLSGRQKRTSSTADPDHTNTEARSPSHCVGRARRPFLRVRPCTSSSPRAGGGAASAEERPSNGHSTPQPRSPGSFKQWREEQSVVEWIGARCAFAALQMHRKSHYKWPLTPPPSWGETASLVSLPSFSRERKGGRGEEEFASDPSFRHVPNSQTLTAPGLSCGYADERGGFKKK